MHPYELKRTSKCDRVGKRTISSNKTHISGAMCPCILRHFSSANEATHFALPIRTPARKKKLIKPIRAKTKEVEEPNIIQTFFQKLGVDENV